MVQRRGQERGGPRRARSLWDETRKPHVPRTKALIRAILYELQPIRFSTLNINTGTFSFIRTKTTTLIQKVPKITKSFVTVSLPRLTKISLAFLRNRSLRQWACLVAFILYWKIVIYLHDLLHAGPIVMIITVLTIIFTVGLGDDNVGSDEEGYVSAYSAFNRGFKSILGSIDADNLVAQHVGGGAAAAMIGGGMEMQDGFNDNGEEQQLNQPRRRNQQIHHQHNHQHPAEEDEQAQRQAQGQAQEDENRNRSRKSGKKARRKRNVEEKKEHQREIQRQREAAAAMGFGDAGMDDIAMNRLIEEQAAEAERLNNGFHDEDDED